MADSILDSYLVFDDAEAASILKQRLTPDASEFYCMVGNDPTSAANFYCTEWEEALQVVRAMAVASRKLSH
jgi:hypothetical protein